LAAFFFLVTWLSKKTKTSHKTKTSKEKDDPETPNKTETRVMNTGEVSLPTGSHQDKVPRIIHQTWKTESVPERFRPLVQSFLDNHPSWEYKLWTDLELSAFMEKEYPWFFPFWKSYPHHIQRVDSARYFILYHYGGVYADLDFLCLTPLDPIVDQIPGVIFGQEGMLHYDGTQRIGNAIIFSSPRHPFWLHVFSGLMESHAKSDAKKISSVFNTTGPSFLHEIFLKKPAGCTAMTPSAFYPLAWRPCPDEFETIHRRQYPKSFCVHLWSSVWRDEPRKVSVSYQHQKTVLSELLFVLPRKKDQGWGVIETTLSRGELYKSRVIDKCIELLEPGDRVIVVGAYLGHLVIPLARLLSEGEVHAFEPDSRSRFLLNESVHENQLQNVKIYDVFPCSHTVRLFRVNKFNAAFPHRIIWRPSQPSAIDITMGSPLDALLLEPVNLIYIEANGEEYAVLQGAQCLIERDRPFLIIEIWNMQKRAEFQSPVRDDQVFSFLDRLKYTYQILQGSTYLCMPEEIFAE